MQRLGLEYASVAQRNPRIIYCSICGFGEDSDLPGYDTIGQARSGLLSLLDRSFDPQPVGISLSDHVTGLYACQGILAAVHPRTQRTSGNKSKLRCFRRAFRSCRKRHHDISRPMTTPTRQTRVRSAQVFAFLAGDGLPFVVHLSSPPKFWIGLTEAIGQDRFAK